MPQGVKAPAVTHPRGLPPEKARTEIIAAIQQMDDVVSRCEVKFGSNVKLLDHPILGPLTANQLHLVHGLHHVKQIWRLNQAEKKEA